MALTVEDGSIVTGADSYISVADFTTYYTARGYTLTGDEEEMLLRAMLYVEQLSFKGQKQTKAQPLQWPRYYVTIDGFDINTNEIPQQLIDLQCEVALAIDGGDDPLGTIGRSVKREKVDVIEREYMDNAVPFAINRKIKALEKKLTRVSSGGLVFRVDRA